MFIYLWKYSNALSGCPLFNFTTTVCSQAHSLIVYVYVSKCVGHMGNFKSILRRDNNLCSMFFINPTYIYSNEIDTTVTIIKRNKNVTIMPDCNIFRGVSVTVWKMFTRNHPTRCPRETFQQVLRQWISILHRYCWIPLHEKNIQVLSFLII